MKQQAHDIIRELILHILYGPSRYEWTAQGLGMLRVYLRPEVRLHIWSRLLINPGVSTIHTHPWDFTSYVISGQMIDHEYVESHQPKAKPFMRQKILCGEGGGLKDSPEFVQLAQLDRKIYNPGDCYQHAAHHIHDSRFIDGTITLVTREFKDDTDHAYVYWPATSSWGTAEPRKATTEEVVRVTDQAIELLNGSF